MERGRMSVRQLAWFFDRPYQTVYTWVYRNREPFPFYKDEVLNRLALLEHMIGKLRSCQPFVPKTVESAERESYVRSTYANARVLPRAAAQ
jgi:hypothetical protein